MPLSDNVVVQNHASSVFEESLIENQFEDSLNDFDPFEAFASGSKEKDGSVRVTTQGEPAADDKKPTPGEKPAIEELTDQDNKIDAFLENHLNGDVEEDDDNKNGDAGIKPKPSANNNEVNPNQAYYDLMVASGFWDKTDDFDGSDEAIEKMQAQDREKIREEEVTSFIDEAFENNPEGKVYGKALLNHLAQGGSVSDFVSIYSNDDINADNLDNENAAVAENTATRMLAAYHQMTGMEPEESAAFIKRKKEKGLLIDSAKDIANPFTKAISRQKTETAQSLAAQTAARKAAAVNKQKTILGLIKENDKVRDFTIGKTQKEKDEFSKYLLQGSVELENGNKIPQFHADLNEVKKDPEWDLYLAASVRAFKNKQSAAAKPAATAKTSIKDTIKEVLQNNAIKANQHTASSENPDTGRPSSRAKAWEGLS